MKKIIQLTMLAVLLFSCNGSKKGNWSEADRKAFFKVMEDANLGTQLGDYKEAWLECYYSKAEKNFAFFREADQNEAKVMELAISCNKEIYSAGSYRGNWSKASRDKFYQVIETSDFSNLGENKKKYFECYLKKLEAKYSSILETDKDPSGCEKLATECVAEMGL
jgi:hypothetical protein